MRRLLWSMAVGAALLPGAGHAQAGDLGDIFRDAWWLVRSPARATTADLSTAALLAGGTAGLVFLADDAVHDWLHSDPWPAKLLAPFRESSPVSLAGRSYVLVPVSAVLYLAGHAFDSADLRDAGTGCATANLTTTVTRVTIARLIGRERPGAHRGAFQFELFAFGGWDQRSFPGGHAANIMSCASFFNHLFDLDVAGPALWALAAGVGLGRLRDDAHWLSDTFAGLSYGYATGRGIAHRYMERRRQEQTERSLQPGLGIRWTIVF